MNELPPVDLVYTWVDGSSPVFAARIEKYRKEQAARSKAPTPYGYGPYRFRDLDNLRFSLRSVAQNASWFRRIFIVTNGQVPRWLRKDAGVEIVTHEQIFERPEVLPTFNACAIETQLHRIPGLGRYFVFMNDDFFFSRPTPKDYFFGKNGLPRLLLSPEPINPNPNRPNRWYGTLARLARLMTERFGERIWRVGAHGPACFDRDALAAVYALWPQEIEHASRNRFRDETDMQLHALYMNTLLALDEQAGKGEAERHEYAILEEKELRIISVGETGKGWRGNLEEVLRDPPRLLCLNDNAPSELTSAEFAGIEKDHRAFLEAMFPKPSPWES
jgi:hypothetical protein